MKKQDQKLIGIAGGVLVVSVIAILFLTSGETVATVEDKSIYGSLSQAESFYAAETLEQSDEDAFVSDRQATDDVTDSAEGADVSEAAEENQEAITLNPVDEVPMLTGAELLDEGIVVEAPFALEVADARAIFEERALEDERYNIVLEKFNSISGRLIKDLAVNPEMISFVVNYPDGKPDEVGLNQAELDQRCPLLLQWDPRWGYNQIDQSTISVSGCGPTTLAMIILGVTDQVITPAEVAEYAVEKGYYRTGSGTAWALMSTGAEHFGVSSKLITCKESTMKEELDKGNLLILSVKEGDFTLNGHFMAVIGYDEDGFIINDPMCIYRSKQRWSFSQLRGQIKGVWSAGELKEVVAPKKETVEEAQIVNTDIGVQTEAAEAVQPETVQSELVQPETVQSELVQPETVQPETAETTVQP